MAASFSFAPRFLGKQAGSDVLAARDDFDALLDRVRNRLYPENTSVLASYWLKTVYRAGHKRAWWQEMHQLLVAAPGSRVLPEFALVSLAEMETWIEQNVLRLAKLPEPPSAPEEPFRPALRAERLRFYIVRLLNQWLPVEVARVLLDPAETAIPPEDGIPPLAVGRALERLLVRERLPRETLEKLLDPELLTAESAYPAHVEIFRDVVLYLLGRTQSPPSPVLPAVLLGVAEGAALPPDYHEAVRRAFLVTNDGAEELRVPVAPPQALHILTADPVRIGSLIVTRDGRLWESENLQSGERHFVIYRPAGRLRMDNSADHARLHLPWPAMPLRWGGAVQLPGGFELFGRQWSAASCELVGDRILLHLVSSQVLPVAEALPSSETGERRAHPAWVDMAWAELRDALDASASDRSIEHIEQLRRSDLVALGRAIFALTESLRARFPRRETVEIQLKAIRYHESEVSLHYGRMPWSVLPARLQISLRKQCSDAVLRDLCVQVFEEAPLPAAPSSFQAA